jgi:hypothetical protein
LFYPGGIEMKAYIIKLSADFVFFTPKKSPGAGLFYNDRKCRQRWKTFYEGSIDGFFEFGISIA